MSSLKKRITFSEHCHRSSSLLEYAKIQVEQSAYLLTILMLNYPTLSVEWSSWATQLRSVSQAMEAQSLSLCMMAHTNLPVMDDRPLTLREASLIYSRLLGEKNDNA